MADDGPFDAAQDGHPSSGLRGVFGLPFTEQVAFFRRKLKNLVPTQAWDDLIAAEHDDAFMVAGATKADLLTDLAAATDKAISQGRGIEEFRKDFRAIVARNGWTGWTGEGSVKGEAWRVGVIYRTNAYTSYAAGRYAQLKRDKFPLWVYFHGNSKEPRPQHLSWNGIALPPDHPFWKTHYPPSDWGCSCYAIGARSEAGVRRLGGDPDKKLPAGWDRIDPKTGTEVGIGKGWGYAPGASVSEQVNAIAGKIDGWDANVASAFLDELPPARADALAKAYRALPSTADDVRRYAQRVYEPNPDLPELAPTRPLSLVPAAQADRIDGLVASDVAGYRFSIDPAAIAASDATPAEFARLPALLNAPDSIERAGAFIRYRWTVDGEEWEALFAVDPDKRALKLVDLVIGKAAA